VTPAYWHVTFSNPPLNLQDPDTIPELQELVGMVEADDALRVVVLESSDLNFFINHYDVSRAAETPVAPGLTSLPAFIDATARLATTSVVTIAKIRGRNRGGGSEAALAFDLRFASREKAVFGQPEVGAGMFPGGGALERLPLMVGRARALEIILGSDDFDADMAALYGWINRAVPDDELDDFVHNFAHRIASFDKPALAANSGGWWGRSVKDQPLLRQGSGVTVSKISRYRSIKDQAWSYITEWGRQGSNLRPRDYESPALTTELLPRAG
jgi:enoyl-CoA hydratase/carnithine racemase